MSAIEIAFVAGSSLGGMLVYFIVLRAVTRVRGRKARLGRSFVSVAGARPFSVEVRAMPGKASDIAATVGNIDNGDFDLITESEESDPPEEGIDATLEEVPVSNRVSRTDDPQNELDLDKVAPVNTADLAIDPEMRWDGRTVLADEAASPEAPSKAALAPELEAYRLIMQQLGDQVAEIADRLTVLEAAESRADLQARIESLVEVAISATNGRQADVDRQIEAQMTPLFERLKAFETEQAMLMRSASLASMRAVTTLQVDIDALKERIVTLSIFRSDLPMSEDETTFERQSSGPRAVGSGQANT